MKTQRGQQIIRDALKRGNETQRSRRFQVREEYLLRPSLCAECIEPLSYTKRKNKFCSKRCAAIQNNQNFPKRKRKNSTCKHCSSPLKNKQSSAIFCSRQCGIDYQYETRIRGWLAGELEGGTEAGVRPWVRKWLFAQRGEKCEECGWCDVHPITGKIPVEIHHIGSNNIHTPDNLKILCPNHHSLTATYRSLNIGNGRKKRLASKA